MDLNNFTLSRWLGLEALVNVENYGVGMNLRSLLNCRNRRIDI